MTNGDKDKSQGRLAKLLLVSYAMHRASYIVRGLAGAYLVYLMYQLFSEAGKSDERLSVVMIAVGVFMIIAGIYFMASAIYAMANGIYAENEPAEEETEEPADESI